MSRAAKAKPAPITDDPNPLVVIGGNHPPEPIEEVAPTPYEQAKKRIDDLYDEAKLWLDGAVVDSKELADGIKNLRTLIQDAHKEADAARKAENEAFDKGKAEVQTRYNLLIGKTTQVTGKTLKAIAAIEKALEPWLQAEADRLEKIAAEQRRIADEALAKAQEAIRSTDASNLSAREDAEELLTDAKRADRDANRAEKTTARIEGNFGRALTLRKVYTATLNPASEDGKIADGRVLALRHFCKVKPREVGEFIQRLADEHIRFGDHLSDEIPGFTITMERKL